MRVLTRPTERLARFVDRVTEFDEAVDKWADGVRGPRLDPVFYGLSSAADHGLLWLAIGALRAAREHGVRVPERLAVVGMDDIEMSAYTDPPLTTVRIEKDVMGRLAAEWLITLIEGTAAARPAVQVPIELIVRGTCGAAGTPPPTRSATEDA